MSLQITKKHVDNYQPGRTIPNCLLSADLEGDSTEAEVVPFRYQIKLLGAREPYNMFTIKPPTSSTSLSVLHHSSPPFISLRTKRSHISPSPEGMF